MQPLHRHLAPQSLPEIPVVSRCDTNPQYPIKDPGDITTNDAVSLLPTPKLSVAAQDLLALLDKIHAEMTEEIARVTTAISEVENNVKLLRFDRMKDGCIRSAVYFLNDEERNNMQIL